MNKIILTFMFLIVLTIPTYAQNYTDNTTTVASPGLSIANIEVLSPIEAFIWRITRFIETMGVYSPEPIYLDQHQSATLTFTFDVPDGSVWDCADWGLPDTLHFQIYDSTLSPFGDEQYKAIAGIQCNQVQDVAIIWDLKYQESDGVATVRKTVPEGMYYIRGVLKKTGHTLSNSDWIDNIYVYETTPPPPPTPTTTLPPPPFTLSKEGNLTYKICTATECIDYHHTVILDKTMNEFTFDIPTTYLGDYEIKDLRIDFGYEDLGSIADPRMTQRCLDSCDYETDCGLKETVCVSTGTVCKSPSFSHWTLVGTPVYAIGHTFKVVKPIVQCYTDADCKDPCPGMFGRCVNDMCEYSGECLMPPPNIWDSINAVFETLWMWILGQLGW